MLSTAPTVHDPEPLRAAMSGPVVAPGDASWDEARQAWNLSVDQRPALVALPESIADVQAAVNYARANGLPVAVQGTGHQAAAIASLEGALLIKTAGLKGVKIDPDARRAYVRAGALWAEVTGPASEHGLAPLAGSSPDVGVVGYTLGGGVSWLARRYGLACNSVTAIAVVLPDGRLVRTDAEHHSDLFWALRGGGGAVGVVVGLEMELHPAHELVAGGLMFPWERAREVLHAWREWVRGVPDEVTSSARILQVPPMPDVPEPVRGRAFVQVEAVLLGTPEQASELLAPLRALGPEIDTVAPIPPAALSHLHMDPEHPVPARGDHAMLADVPHELIDDLVDVGGHESGSPLLALEIRHLGGAVGRAAAGAGALERLAGEFLLFAVGIPMDAGVAAALEGRFERVRAVAGPYDCGRAYTNFVERPTPLAESFDDETYARLREVKARYDADDLFSVARAVN